MSSLAASKADNFYFPPEWRPEMGSISKFQGSKGANQYEKYGIIRFELPFDAWCLQCSRHMSKGLRFNAKKDRVGKYLSTTIWAFTMKCYSCDQRFVIKTDPEHSTYLYEQGLRKHEQDYIPDADDGVIILADAETKQALAKDPMFRLEHEHADKLRSMTEQQRLEEIQTIREEEFKDDFQMNSLLRSKNRAKRKLESEQREEGRKRSLSIPLLPPSADDADQAKELHLRVAQKQQQTAEQRKLLLLSSQSIFANKPSSMKTKSAMSATSLLSIAPAGHGKKSVASLAAPAYLKVRPRKTD